MLYLKKKKKTEKIAAALGAALPNPRWPPAAGDLPPDPQVVIPTQFTCYFWALRRFLGIVKIKITTYYLILEWQLMGPLAKLAPPWLKPPVTPLPATLLANFSDTWQSVIWQWCNTAFTQKLATLSKQQWESRAKKLHLLIFPTLFLEFCIIAGKSKFS